MNLTMCVVGQIFWRADSLNKIYSPILQGLKDCLLFGVAEMFSQMRFGTGSNMVATSRTEKFLTGKRPSQVLRSDKQSAQHSLFDLKAQIHLIKIHMSFSSAIMDLILRDKNVLG